MYCQFPRALIKLILDTSKCSRTNAFVELSWIVFTDYMDNFRRVMLNVRILTLPSLNCFLLFLNEKLRLVIVCFTLVFISFLDGYKKGSYFYMLHICVTLLIEFDRFIVYFSINFSRELTPQVYNYRTLKFMIMIFHYYYVFIDIKTIHKHSC